MKQSFFSLLIAFALPISIFAQTGDIQGTVYQRGTEKPVAGADVRITETEQTEKTDENGIFRFTELPEGTYTFVVTHSTETAPTAVSVAISSGDTTEVKVYLGEAVKLESLLWKGNVYRQRSVAPTSAAANSYAFRVSLMTHSKD